MNVLFAIIIGGFSAGQAAPGLTTFRTGAVAAANAFGIIDRKPALVSGTVRPAAVVGEVALEGVVFAYPTRPAVPVLRCLILRAAPSQTLALVGQSGSGKSSVVQLLQRFYDPQGGCVTLDGVDLRHLDLSWLRRQMGLVSQEPSLFATSIYKNILFGRDDATKEEVEAAAAAANAAEFIAKLPEGYDTRVGERGVQLSGGQKQRVAIARAVLRNPRVLLLDEATSALDSESERVVQKALDILMVGRTSLIIAHRLSTIRDADCIAVMAKGKMIERGTHDELLASGGRYAELHNYQHGGSKGSLTGGSKAVLGGGAE